MPDIDRDLAVWRCHIEFLGDWRPDAEPYDVLEVEGNMLTVRTRCPTDRT